MLFPESTHYRTKNLGGGVYTAGKILETIFKNSNEGLLVISTTGEVQQVNTALANALKTTPDKMIGRSLSDVCKHMGLRRLVKVMGKGKPEFGKIDSIDGRSFLIDYIPIIENQHIQGALAKISFLNSKQGPKNESKSMDSKNNGANKENNTVCFNIDHIVGTSPQIVDLKETVLKVAPRNSNILITGESGTGKELFAQAIHAASLRRSGPFIKINCAAIPDTLLESELFGYEEGAFTGGRKGGQAGKLEMAGGGTVFLDEIGDLSFALQAKLLRFIQDKEVQKLGAGQSKIFDVRVVAATNVNLEQMVKYKKFREDLYYRLNVVNLHIPPLRERKEDLMVLTNCFLEKYNRLFGINVAGLDDEVEQIFQRYEWPGNARELENVIERAFNIIEGNIINKNHLPNHLANFFNNEKLNREFESLSGAENLSLNLVDGQTLAGIMHQVEKIVILQALMKTKGNKAKAAQILDISRPGLYKKLAKYNLM